MFRRSIFGAVALLGGCVVADQSIGPEGISVTELSPTRLQIKAGAAGISTTSDIVTRTAFQRAAQECLGRGYKYFRVDDGSLYTRTNRSAQKSVVTLNVELLNPPFLPDNRVLDAYMVIEHKGDVGAKWGTGQRSS